MKTETLHLILVMGSMRLRIMQTLGTTGFLLWMSIYQNSDSYKLLAEMLTNVRACLHKNLYGFAILHSKQATTAATKRCLPIAFN